MPFTARPVERTEVLTAEEVSIAGTITEMASISEIDGHTYPVDGRLADLRGKYLRVMRGLDTLDRVEMVPLVTATAPGPGRSRLTATARLPVRWAGAATTAARVPPGSRLIIHDCHDADVASRPRAGRLLPTAACLLALVMTAGCASGSAAPDPEPMRILVVNDEGWSAPGVVALREALRREGHQVTEIAPDGDRRSAGTATTMAGEIIVRNPTPDPDVWSVSGTPSDAVLVGVRAVMGDAWPDLVIAGISSRPAVGVTSMQSGAVGAALTAAAMDFPAVAVSADVPGPNPAPAEFERPADFTVRLVTELARQRPTDARLMAQRTVLNVNYPVGPQEPQDVVSAPTANVPAESVSYRYGEDLERFIPEPTRAAPTGGDNDAQSLASGRITLTDLSADPDRSAPPSRTAARLAPALTP